jgi:hypothetical protein
MRMTYLLLLFNHENKHCQICCHALESLIKRSFVRTKGFQQSKNSITIL